MSKRPVGRPSKSRGAPKSSDAADARWTVRGVPLNVRGMAIQAAGERDMPVGDWLSEAVVAYVRAGRGAPPSRLQADRARIAAFAATQMGFSIGDAAPEVEVEWIDDQADAFIWRERA